MKSTWLRWVSCAAALYVGGMLSANAAFTGYFAVPPGTGILADQSGSPVAVGNWWLDGSSNTVVELDRSPALVGNANAVNLTAMFAGSWGEFYIVNASADTYALTFSWNSSNLDHAADGLWYYLNGDVTPLAVGAVGLQGGSVGPINVAPGDKFGWRVVSSPAQGGEETPTTGAFQLDNPVKVPEPSSALLLLLGAAGVALRRRRS